MNLTDAQREECYALLGEDFVYMGEFMGASKKRLAADCVIEAFSQLADAADGQPSFREVKQLARHLARKDAKLNDKGEEVVGSIILTAILMAFIGWCTRLLLDWLVKKWFEKNKKGQH